MNNFQIIGLEDQVNLPKFVEHFIFRVVLVQKSAFLSKIHKYQRKFSRSVEKLLQTNQKFTYFCSKYRLGQTFQCTKLFKSIYFTWFSFKFLIDVKKCCSFGGFNLFESFLSAFITDFSRKIDAKSIYNSTFFSFKNY